MENETFLPNDYQAPASNSNYMRFEDGKNKFRVLSSAIVGWVDWSKERTPIRTKTEPETLVDPAKPAKHFWAFVVWNYQTNTVNILEVTQVGIRNSIIALVTDNEWGDPKGYDITITREGKELDTKYTTMPSPHSEAPGEALATFMATKIDLEQLYVNGDPFKKD